MLKVFPFHYRNSNNRGVVSKGIINFYEVLVKFSPAINNILLKVDIRGEGGGFVSSSYINVVAVLSYVIDEAIQRSHIVRDYASIPLRVGPFSSLCQFHEFL
jgi:hypothetical protein